MKNWHRLFIAVLMLLNVQAAGALAADGTDAAKATQAVQEDTWQPYGDVITRQMLVNLEPPSDALIEQIAHEWNMEYARGQKGDDRFYAVDGSPIYPPNDGAQGHIVKMTLCQGTVVNRYGYYKGRYFAKEGESFQHRSLPRNTDLSQYHRFVVKKPVHVELAIIAPWFGEPGGGVQYKIPDEVYNSFDEYFQEIPAA